MIFNDLKKIYKDKKVLVTGHTGFKGSWLTTILLKLEAKVVGYGLDPLYEEDIFNVTDLKNKVNDIRGDIRDKTKLNELIIKEQPDFIFHLAAQPLVKDSYIIPSETFEINAMGTVNILESIRNLEKSLVAVMVTSDKCYVNNEWIYGYREIEPLGGIDPYSASKGCSEIIINSYIESFFKTSESKKFIASARAGNVIGGGDWSKNRLIPDAVKSLKTNKKIEIRNPNSIRPWQHVLEPLTGYLILGAKLFLHGNKFSGAWNFGPKSENIVTVENLISNFINFWGNGEYEIKNEIKAEHEAKLLNLDITKAQLFLNWKPVWNITKTINQTVNWYKNFNIYDPYEICINQIESYFQDVN
jgi:CDP-glucose 4,6-dehydratase